MFSTSTCGTSSAAIPHHSPHIFPDLWSPQSSSANASSATSPSIDTQSPALKFSATASNSSRKRSATPAVEPVVEDRAEKRRRNNAAAAKYRQKKVDRIDELEGQLQTMATERDELKIALAKRDAEVELLRSMLASKT